MFTVKSRNGWSKTLKADSAQDAADLSWPDHDVMVDGQGNVRDAYIVRRVLGTVTGEPEPEPAPAPGDLCRLLGDYRVEHVNCEHYPAGTITDVRTGEVVGRS